MLFTRLAAAALAWPTAGAVVLLLANDWYLKAAFPGFLTGKVSDFAGLFVVGALGFAACPKAKVSVALLLGLMFAYWKSAYSAPLINLLNEFLPLRLARTVDLSDLFALIVLPLARRVALAPARYAIRPNWVVQSMRIPLFCALCFGVMGTSVIQLRQDYSVRFTGAGQFVPAAMADAIAQVAKARGLECTQCGRLEESGEYSARGLTLMYRIEPSRGVQFTVFSMPTALFFGASAYERADSLRNTLKRALSERFRGLEYVESLSLSEK
jgi:hypothetical protein